jgi:uncharacterized protein (TIGR03382 family)
VTVLAKLGSPLTFVRQGGTLQNDSAARATMVAAGQNVTGAVTVNAPCNSDIYVTLAAAGGGPTLQNVTVEVDPLVNCMVPSADGGMGGGAGGGGGGTGGGSGTTTQTLPSVGANSTTEQPNAKTGCGCTSPADFGAPLMALVMVMVGRRRRHRG